MKKVLFVLINMNVGGTEKSFLNLVDQLPQDQYDISLLLLEKKGGLLSQIPPHIRILELKEYADLKPVLSNTPMHQFNKLLMKRSFKEAFIFISAQMYRKFKNNSRLYYKFLMKDVPELNEEFDLAIAYAGPMDFITYLTNYRIKAKEKIQWIHFDVTRIGFDFKFAKDMYEHFNKVYVVSKQAADKLIHVIPEIENKVEVHENIISSAKIKELASQNEVLKYSGIKIVTVARLTKEKAPERALKVCKDLLDNDFNITWHWIGDGHLKNNMRQLINEYNLEDNFILEGSQVNPYPYIQQADIYVQPSEHEGYCITIAEAKALHKPIVTTSTAGAMDQITHKVTGLITEINDQSLFDGIKTLLEDPSLRYSLIQTLHKQVDKTRSNFI